MTDDNTHNIALDFQHKIFELVGAGAPTTVAPLANIGTGYTDRSTGNYYKMMSGGWTQLAAVGTIAWTAITGKPTTVAGFGITDVYTKTAADARYLQLTGGTLTGDLVGTRLTFHDNLIYESFTNGVANLALNYLGYAGGTTQYRNATIYDGKSAAILTLTGSDKSAAFAGPIYANNAGYVLGQVAGVARILYGASAGSAFSILNAANGYADFYVGNVFLSGTLTATGVLKTGTTGTGSGGQVDYIDDGGTLRWAAGILGSTGARDFVVYDNAAGAARLTIDHTTGYITIPKQTNVNGNVASDYMLTVQQSNASGYGLFIKPGSDSLAALAINNAANSAQTIQLFGNGSALFAGTIDTQSFVSFLVSGTNYGYIKAAQSATDLIASSALGDFCIRSDNKRILFSVDAGATAAMTLTGGALVVGSAGAAHSAGDITAARSSTTGVLYFGAGSLSYLYFDGSNYNFGGNGSSANLNVVGNINAVNAVLSGTATLAGEQVATIKYGSTAPTSATAGVVGELFGVT